MSDGAALGLFVAAIIGAPALMFAAAVLLDHFIHGPNRPPPRRRDHE